MGPRAIKLLTGTRLWSVGTRAPKEKLRRIRSGIHKLRVGAVPPEDAERYIAGLVGQIRFINQLCPKDATPYARVLSDVCNGKWLDGPSKKFLADSTRG
jgi:hypothetical protein